MNTTLPLDKYPDTEARTPRETFTAKLRKMCQRLDRKSAGTLSFKHWYLDKFISSDVEITGVWVVGSYARGALTCGDLDLVVERDVHRGTLPPAALVKKTFLGSVPGLRVYEGTPDDNSSCAVFTEAVKVWAPGLDWSAALDAIQPDPSASRFARPGDAIPLRPEQHLLTFGTHDELLSLQASGVLKWSFVPLSELAGYAPFEPRSEFEKRSFEQFSEGSASKTRAAALVFGAARALAAERGCHDPVAYSWARKNVVKAGAFEVHFERMDVSVLPLHEAGCSAVAFLPALSTRGPNGVWLIERGPSHELVTSFAETSAWALVDQHGSPQQIQFSTSDKGEMLWVHGVELFASEDDALDCEQAWREHDDAPEDWKVPRLLRGTEVANLLAGMDVVVLYGGETLVALTSRGVRYAEAARESEVLRLSVRQVGKQLQQLLNPEQLAA